MLAWKSAARVAPQRLIGPLRRAGVRLLLSGYASAACATALIVTLSVALERYVYIANVSLLFVGVVVLCAASWGLGPALLAAALSLVSLNYFFFAPLHDLAVKDPENIVAVTIFAGVAVFVGRLTARARSDARLAENRAQVMSALYAFARRLTTIEALDELLQVTVDYVASALSLDAVLLLREQETMVVRAASSVAPTLEPEELARAERVWQQPGEGAAAGSAPVSSRYLYLPLRGVGGAVGVIGVSFEDLRPALAAEEMRLLEAIADQAGVAIERMMLAADIERARITAEAESLRSAMLSAISHDLKTPLASILGAATSLGTYNSYFEQQQREELIATIREEAERMSRFIANLLDITRVESGTLEVRSELTDVEEVIGATARRARQVLGARKLVLQLAPDLPMLTIDGVLLEQTLFNLLDNAANHSPAQSSIVISAKCVNKWLTIKVMDEGCGIPPADVRRIFEKFYRGRDRREQRAGTGLGLAICRGFVEAMGGRIIAGNRTDRTGAVFMIGFPVPATVPVPHVPVADDD